MVKFLVRVTIATAIQVSLDQAGGQASRLHESISSCWLASFTHPCVGGKVTFLETCYSLRSCKRREGVGKMQTCNTRYTQQRDLASLSLASYTGELSTDVVCRRWCGPAMPRMLKHYVTGLMWLVTRDPGSRSVAPTLLPVMKCRPYRALVPPAVQNALTRACCIKTTQMAPIPMPDSCRALRVSGFEAAPLDGLRQSRQGCRPSFCGASAPLSPTR
ncbi:hypothetical protein GE09DRAFT_450091 [Coniochaeta sp. 2T2.1]|nr:hypothetical protein GE09DRAFT_450091 [Coniochaeta sp. 2T2.1]